MLMAFHVPETFFYIIGIRISISEGRVKCVGGDESAPKKTHLMGDPLPGLECPAGITTVSGA